MRILLPFLCLLSPAALTAQVIDSQVPRPVAPFVVGGACPFECCRLGEWTIGERAVLRALPSRVARPVGEVAPGVRIRADTSLVVVSRLGLVVVKRAYREAEFGLRLSKGDSLIVLDYLGEGTTRVWWHGQLALVFMFWDEAAMGHATGAKLVRPAIREWWARVAWRDAAGTHAGWLEATRYRVDGTDACSGSLPGQGRAPRSDPS